MKINNAVFISSVVDKKDYPQTFFPEFLLSGRSNVGKSSFINCLLNRKAIAHISSKPGKTQTLNFYLVNNNFYLVDVPGYGYAKTNHRIREKFGAMIEMYLASRKQLKKVFLLIDYRHKPTEDDILMYEFLRYYQIEVVVIATKADKVSKNKRKQHNETINEAFGAIINVVPFSAVTKEGRSDVLKIISSNI